MLKNPRRETSGRGRTMDDETALRFCAHCKDCGGENTHTLRYVDLKDRTVDIHVTCHEGHNYTYTIYLFEKDKP